MFDENFCLALEFAISRALKESEEIDWRRCWCDGILLPDKKAEYSAEQITKTKEVLTSTWIEGQVKGEHRGQFLYKMKLNFGDDSLQKLKLNNRLEECITDTGAESWIILDRENRTIEIQLM